MGDFGSVEEVFEWMQANEDAAIARSTELQWSIGYGDYFCRVVWEMGEEIPIFGYIWTKDELEQGERELGADEEEIELVLSSTDMAYARGYRFGTCYSTAVPEGEIGSTHVALMYPITEDEFKDARDLGWDPGKLRYTEWWSELGDRIG